MRQSIEGRRSHFELGNKGLEGRDRYGPYIPCRSGSPDPDGFKHHRKVGTAPVSLWELGTVGVAAVFTVGLPLGSILGHNNTPQSLSLDLPQIHLPEPPNLVGQVMSHFNAAWEIVDQNVNVPPSNTEVIKALQKATQMENTAGGLSELGFKLVQGKDYRSLHDLPEAIKTYLFTGAGIVIGDNGTLTIFEKLVQPDGKVVAVPRNISNLQAWKAVGYEILVTVRAIREAAFQIGKQPVGLGAVADSSLTAPPYPREQTDTSIGPDSSVLNQQELQALADNYLKEQGENPANYAIVAVPAGIWAAENILTMSPRVIPIIVDGAIVSFAISVSLVASFIALPGIVQDSAEQPDITAVQRNQLIRAGVKITDNTIIGPNGDVWALQLENARADTTAQAAADPALKRYTFYDPANPKDPCKGQDHTSPTSLDGGTARPHMASQTNIMVETARKFNDEKINPAVLGRENDGRNVDVYIEGLTPNEVNGWLERYGMQKTGDDIINLQVLKGTLAFVRQTFREEADNGDCHQWDVTRLKNPEDLPLLKEFMALIRSVWR